MTAPRLAERWLPMIVALLIANFASQALRIVSEPRTNIRELSECRVFASPLELGMTVDDVLPITGQPTGRIFGELEELWFWEGPTKTPGISEIGFEHSKLVFIRFSAPALDERFTHSVLGESSRQSNGDYLTMKTYQEHDRSLSLAFVKPSWPFKDAEFRFGILAAEPTPESFRDQIQVWRNTLD